MVPPPPRRFENMGSAAITVIFNIKLPSNSLLIDALNNAESSYSNEKGFIIILQFFIFL
jgi:hypothetical protein